MKKDKMKKENKKQVILIATGGTGGHIFPALSIISQQKFDRYLIITDKRGENYFTKFLDKKNINALMYVQKVISPSQKLIINKFISLFYFGISFLKSIILVIKHQPDVAIGFGGYPSISPILAAKFFGIDIIIHEQNAVIGRANKLLSHIANLVALSFKETKNIRSYKNFIYSGNPVRDEFYEIGKSKYSFKL